MFKKIKKVHDICPVCEDKRDLILGTQDEELNIRKEKIKVKTKILYCPTGDHYFYDPDHEEEKIQTAYREYRKRKSLLQPEEIRSIREKHGLTQKEFAKFLGFGDITIHRYETGAIQDSAHNSLLILINNIADFRKLFEQRKVHLPAELADKIEKKLAEQIERTIKVAFEDRAPEKGYKKLPCLENEKNWKIVVSTQSINKELALAA